MKVGEIDGEGKNSLERTLQMAMRLGLEPEDEDYLLPPPAELIASEPVKEKTDRSEVATSQNSHSVDGTPAVQVASAARDGKLDQDAVEVSMPKHSVEAEIAETTPSLTEPAPLKGLLDSKPRTSKARRPLKPERGPQHFPEAKPAQEAMKKYLESKESIDMDEVLVPESPSPRSGTVSIAEAQSALKEKVGGIIAYAGNDKIFQSSSEATLKKLAERLVKNPQETVLFQGQLAEGETYDLVQERFEIIQNRLEKMKVSKNQILLDDKRMVGDWAEFRMYILRI